MPIFQITLLTSRTPAWSLSVSHGPLLAVLTHHFMGDCHENTYFENIENIKYCFMKKYSDKILTINCLDNFDNFNFKNIALCEMK